MKDHLTNAAACVVVGAIVFLALASSGRASCLEDGVATMPGLQATFGAGFFVGCSFACMAMLFAVFLGRRL